MSLSHFNFFREIHLNSLRNGDFHVIFGAFWDRTPRPEPGTAPRFRGQRRWRAGRRAGRTWRTWAWRDCNWDGDLGETAVNGIFHGIYIYGIGIIYIYIWVQVVEWDWIYLLGLIPFHDSLVYHSTHYHTILDHYDTHSCWHMLVKQCHKPIIDLMSMGFFMGFFMGFKRIGMGL